MKRKTQRFFFTFLFIAWVISASFPTHQQVDGCEHNNGDDEG
jgi:hypothetical protein